ncbi:EpsG family protein [Erwinia oleae]|uniref:EpsG family protein n=1 Tax=Erwinia oleae TaxID=796334 RepID=UPI0005526FA7|nr:EpsG family protein [Erwinia oleae]
MAYWVVLFILFISTLARNNYLIALVLVALFVMAGFIAPEVSHDFQNYYNGYYLAQPRYFPEPISSLIFSGAQHFSLPIAVSFIILAFLATVLKIKALRRLSLPVSLFFLVYFGKLFLLLDLTQVRAAVAVSVCLLSFDAYIKNKKVMAFIYIILAFFFHLSSIMFIVIFFVNRKKPNATFWLVALLCGLGFSFINIKYYLYISMIYLHLPLNYLTYIDNANNSTVNPLNVLAVLNVAIFVTYCFFKKAFIDSKMNVAFKLYGISIISFYVFIDFPVLSFRISEFFLIYQVVLLANTIKFVRSDQRWIYSSVLFVFSALQLYLTYNKAAIIEPYRLLSF